jgi:hypothetical protein
MPIAPTDAVILSVVALLVGYTLTLLRRPVS